ncbi:MAG: hypothetical protein K9J12_18655 [Melioribacteraceae bacterium]|nr:hypothetical protein [Melioribacteraceae bacterium]MCF8264710.1 hypothetical protein [Melioribacteraceae bacterium]MCF8431368.1 hypothetical protein [Melioribacteraceae bacterium]
MSLYPQPDKYRCGPFALKYALVMLGIFKHEDQISILAGSTWWAGTDEIGLAKAAKKFKCKMKYLQSDIPEEAKHLLDAELNAGFPCILSVDNWEHWCTVVNHSKGNYVVIDSGMEKVVNVKSTKQLLEYWRYKDDEMLSYDAYSIHPKFKINTKAKFTPSIAREVMKKRKAELAVKWDLYFNDMISICEPRLKHGINSISFNEFLRRNQKYIVESVANWHGVPAYEELEMVLENMKTIAKVYDLIIPNEEEKHAIVDITSVLMMYSCGKYGMNPIY